MPTPGRGLLDLAEANARSGELDANESSLPMADNLRPRLDRLQELAKTVNSRTDEAGRIVQGVEKYLSEVLHLGVSAWVRIDHEDDGDGWEKETSLAYGRYGDKFRIFVEAGTLIAGDLDDHSKTLWANCPRDIKLKAYNALPKLLDALVGELKGTLDQIQANTETIEGLLPHLKEAKS
jgi:hypothetical protein